MQFLSVVFFYVLKITPLPFLMLSKVHNAEIIQETPLNSNIIKLFLNCCIHLILVKIETALVLDTYVSLMKNYP